MISKRNKTFKEMPKLPWMLLLLKKINKINLWEAELLVLSAHQTNKKKITKIHWKSLIFKGKQIVGNLTIDFQITEEQMRRQQQLIHLHSSTILDRLFKNSGEVSLLTWCRRTTTLRECLSRPEPAQESKSWCDPRWPTMPMKSMEVHLFEPRLIVARVMMSLPLPLVIAQKHTSSSSNNSSSILWCVRQQQQTTKTWEKADQVVAVTRLWDPRITVMCSNKWRNRRIDAVLVTQPRDVRFTTRCIQMHLAKKTL